MRKFWLAAALLAVAGVGCSKKAQRPGEAPYKLMREAVTLEQVHAFDGPMPTGVAVSHEGRIFTNFPRWGDRVEFTLGELRDGKVVPYPSAELNNPTDAEKLLSVQSVVVDPNNRLWALDTGSIEFGPIKGQQWPKLVGIDLRNNQVFKVIHFPSDVVRSKTYLNDVRFDLSRGPQGLAFITDSGVGGLIVVDLASGKSWRKLDGHPAVTPDPAFHVALEGRPLTMKVASDGLALGGDGKRLFFCPLSSRKLYSVSLDALADPALPYGEVAKTLQQEEREFASDGLESDVQGRVYLTDFEHNAINLRLPDGEYRTLVADERLWWPDTLALATNGFLYVTANQLHRQPRLNGGKDLRQKPYSLFRVKVDGRPVLLGRNPSAR
jgi:sugar lactone lactonase YvrE